MSAQKIADNVWSVGVQDPDLTVFDIIMPTEHGTTYNAYLVKGEKVALIDAVKKEFTDTYLANIQEVTPLDSIDYLVVNHNFFDDKDEYHSTRSDIILKLNYTFRF